MRRLFRKLAAEHGMAISTGDTHPFADWSKQTFTSQALIMLKVIVKIFQRNQANMHKKGRADLRLTKQIQNKIS
jgi:gamma-glutamyl:cysteine ligase YbdK (ATP-grasp superfamily)